MPLTAVAGALRAYLADKATNHGRRTRAMVPVNPAPAGAEFELGNYFGIIAVKLPIGIEKSPTRLYHELRRRMDERKKSCTSRR